MADYQGVLADLKSRKATLDRECADLETAIAAVEKLAATATFVASVTAAREPARTFTPRAFSGLTMPQAILELFTYVNEPQTSRQIQDGLKAGGARTSANLRGHVYNTLHRLSQDNGPFVHVDGRWALRRWQSERQQHNVA